MTGTSDNGSRVESLIIATVHQHRLEQRVEELEAALATARDDALEEAANEIDCECPLRAETLASPPNSGARWRACGQDYCAAIEAAAIRALKGKQP